MDKMFNNVLEFINFINSVSEQILADCFGKEIADTIISARCSYNSIPPYAYDFLKSLNAKSLSEYMNTYKDYKANHLEKTVVEYHISELVDLKDLEKSDIICYYNPDYKIGDIVDKNNVFKVTICEDDYIILTSDYNNARYSISKSDNSLNKFASVNISKIFKCQREVKDTITLEVKEPEPIRISDLDIGDSFKMTKRARNQYKLVKLKVPDYEPGQNFICALNYADSKIHFLVPGTITAEGELIEDLDYGDTFRLLSNSGSSSLMVRAKFSRGPYKYCVFNKQTYEIETMDDEEIVPIF